MLRCKNVLKVCYEKNEEKTADGGNETAFIEESRLAASLLHPSIL